MSSTTTGPLGRIRRRLTALAAVFAVSVAGLTMAAAPAHAATTATVYVANFGSGTVSVIDAGSNTVTATIPVGIHPWGEVVNPAGTRLYVANEASSTVSVINTMANTVVDTIATTGLPRALAINSAGTTLFVGGFDKVQMVNTATDTVTATIPVGQLITSIAVSPDGAHAYVLNNGTGSISVIDTATAAVSATWNIFGGAIALSPDGAHLYVAGGGYGLNVVDTATGSVTATVATGTGVVYAIALNPAGTTAYVTNTTSVFAVDLTTDTVTATVPVGSYPLNLAVDSTGTSVYVANLLSNNMVTLNTSTNTVTGSVPVGSQPRGIAVADVPAPPTVGSLSPNHGPEAGGTSVTITGSGFTGASAVTFGTVAASSFTVDSDTQITATAPAHTDGSVDVTVTTGGGTSATGSADLYTYDEPAPAVTAISPASGPEAGGTVVTITGTDFLGATAVHFGTAAAAFTVTSDTQITATAPAGTLGTAVDVTVTTPAGTSATGAADKYTYISQVAKVTAAGRLNIGGHDAEFGFDARATQAGGPIKGRLIYNDQSTGVRIKDSTITVLYLTSPTTAHAEGAASCTIGATTSPCTFTVTATDPGGFTLTYNATTVGGTIANGHVHVSADNGGNGNSATPATAHQLRTATTAPAVDASPATAAMTGGFSASLLGISLNGARCATAALIYTDGTATGDTNCLLLGVLGINIDINLHLTGGTLGTGNNSATVTGTATVTVAGLLPITLPATEVLTASGTSGTTGLQLTVGGVTLPVLPIATGAIQIG